MASLRVACALVVCMLVVAAPMGEAAMPCNQVATRMAPCLNYLKSGGPVPPACCNGIRTLVSSARTTVDRRQACNCLKSAAGSIRGLNQGFAATLPGKCGVNIPYKISMSTNCNTVK